MSDGAQILIPFAVRSDAACRAALRGLSLPHLAQLLVRMREVGFDAGEETSLSPPHERALARTLGWPVTDGLLPWAAQAARDAGVDPSQRGWAWVTPCHWRVGSDHIAMALPNDVPMDDSESEAFFEAVQPYFAEDGITLVRHSAQRWLARGEPLLDLPTASIDRVAGRDIDPWVPRAPAARPLRRLQQEMQMLLYTHPLNDARIARGLLPINSFWISGTGTLPPSPQPSPASGRGSPGSLSPSGGEGRGEGARVADTLAESALRADWPAWSAAWQQLDATLLREALDKLRAGRPLTLTLCGDRAARTWSSEGTGLWQRATSLFRSASPAAMMESL